MQLRKFKRIFEYAREHSEFYREIYTKAGVMDLDIKTWDDVEKVPVIDKELMRKYSLKSQCTMPIERSSIVRCSTSGSTGEPFQLAYSKFANITAYLRVFYIMRKEAKYTPFKKLCILSKYEVNDTFKVEQNISIIKTLQDRIGIFSRRIISVYEDRETIANKLKRYNPDVLYSSSSAVEIVANYIVETNQTMHIPSIILIAEPVSKNQYEKFKAVFGAKVIDIFLGQFLRKAE